MSAILESKLQKTHVLFERASSSKSSVECTSPTNKTYQPIDLSISPQRQPVSSFATNQEEDIPSPKFNDDTVILKQSIYLSTIYPPAGKR